MRKKFLVCLLIFLPVAAVSFLFDIGALLLYAGLLIGILPSDGLKFTDHASVLITLASALVVLVPIIVVFRLTE